MIRKASISLAVLIGSVSMLAACSGKEAKPAGTAAPTPAPEVKQEPVTLKFYTKTVLEDFDKYVNQYVKKKFPHVTLQLVERGQGTQLDDLIASGQIPDIIWEGVTNMDQITSRDLPLDLTPLAKKYNFDMSKYDSKIFDTIKSYSGKGEIYYLPYNVLVFALHYNKDIFDKFGVPYPKDNMTWDDIIELNKKLTRMDGDVMFRGLITGGLNRMASQMSLPYVDPKTEKAVLSTDGWKKLYETWKDASVVVGQPPIEKFGSSSDFTKRRTLAMVPDILMLQNTDMATLEKEGLRWDVVTYPVFKEKPGVGPGVFSDGFIITKASKHPDVAFQVISYLSSDPEVQLAATKDGRITGLSEAKIRQAAFENNPAAKGKNLTNVLAAKYPDPITVTPYDGDARTIVSNKLLDYALGKADVNTLLRQADDEQNKKISEAKTSKSSK
ncbi:MAG: family 1 extracellular solute-binding protein [Paenibacillus sp.]|nr:family 1 extracellular solute-binding protein [Paenibacillus sp.]